MNRVNSSFYFYFLFCVENGLQYDMITEIIIGLIFFIDVVMEYFLGFSLQFIFTQSLTKSS